jgi:hypothetical protein
MSDLHVQQLQPMAAVVGCHVVNLCSCGLLASEE